MSRKHFVAIAAALKVLRGTMKTPIERVTLKKTVEAMADTFAECNDQFDRDRFLSACGF